MVPCLSRGSGSVWRVRPALVPGVWLETIWGFSLWGFDFLTLRFSKKEKEMQYRHIDFKDVRLLPEHINLLRNFQDMHSALTRISDDFPVLELGDIVPNYETRFNNLIIKGNKLLSKFKIIQILYKIDVDYTVGGFAAERLLIRKNKLIDILDFTIDKWQGFCDEIDRLGDVED